MTELETLVASLSDNFSKIIPRDVISKHSIIDWGGNGLGDRWAKKKFNYTVVRSSTTKCYSENDEDIIKEELLNEFREKNKEKSQGILGIFVHSLRTNVQKRPIRKDIDREIKTRACVSCGSKSEIICDHKNDIYNDNDVLDSKKQQISDFQPLCNHCNLQKRQIFREEVVAGKIYSAKNLEKYRCWSFEFPWEKKAFDVKDITTKQDTYWYDPVEFDRKLMCYVLFIRPFLPEIKRRVPR
jgi:hypothetical protein